MLAADPRRRLLDRTGWWLDRYDDGPNHFLGFQRRYQQTAMPFDWRSTHADLDRLLRRLDARAQRPARHDRHPTTLRQ